MTPCPRPLGSAFATDDSTIDLQPAQAVMSREIDSRLENGVILSADAQIGHSVLGEMYALVGFIRFGPAPVGLPWTWGATWLTT